MPAPAFPGAPLTKPFHDEGVIRRPTAPPGFGFRATPEPWIEATPADNPSRAGALMGPPAPVAEPTAPPAPAAAPTDRGLLHDEEVRANANTQPDEHGHRLWVTARSTPESIAHATELAANGAQDGEVWEYANGDRYKVSRKVSKRGSQLLQLEPLDDNGQVIENTTGEPPVYMASQKPDGTWYRLDNLRSFFERARRVDTTAEAAPRPTPQPTTADLQRYIDAIDTDRVRAERLGVTPNPTAAVMGALYEARRCERSVTAARARTGHSRPHCEGPSCGRADDHGRGPAGATDQDVADAFTAAIEAKLAAQQQTGPRWKTGDPRATDPDHDPAGVLAATIDEQTARRIEIARLAEKLKTLEAGTPQ